MKPLVSIIIPARNEEKIIGKAIKGMLLQQYPRKEIIVMDNASTDRTAEIARSYNIKVVVNGKNIGYVSSVNKGIKLAKGEFFILLHADHNAKDKKWIDKMLEPFSDKRVAAVISQRKNKNRNIMSLGERLFDSLSPIERNDTGKPKEITTLREKCDAYRKSVIKKLGYFDEGYIHHGGEDVDMSIKMRKAGHKIILSDKATVEHVFSSYQSSLFSVFKKAFQMGQAGKELYRRYKIDSIRRRMFLMILISLLFYPIAYTSVGFFLYSIIFVAGIFSTVTLNNKKIPISLVSLLIAIVSYTYTKSIFSIATGVLITNIFILFYYGMHSSKNSLRERDNLAYVLAIFVLSITWRFVSAVGYLKEELFPSKV